MESIVKCLPERMSGREENSKKLSHVEIEASLKGDCVSISSERQWRKLKRKYK